jgi:hypothetical protein
MEQITGIGAEVFTKTQRETGKCIESKIRGKSSGKNAEYIEYGI